MAFISRSPDLAKESATELRSSSPGTVLSSP